MKRKFNYILVFILAAFSSAVAQNSLAVYEEDQVEEWQPGYIVLKKSGDTVNGFLMIKTTNYGDFKKIRFRENKEVKEGTFNISGTLRPQDSIYVFSFANKRYRYMNWTDRTMPKSFFHTRSHLFGWVKIVEEGPINICMGFTEYCTLHTTGGMSCNHLPAYSLKKGKMPTIIVEANRVKIQDKSEAFMKNSVDDRNKVHFLKYISDYEELVEKIKDKPLFFWQIEKYVKEYNTWAITQKNKQQ